MKKIKKNLLSNILRLTPQTKIVGGLIGLGLSLGALTLNSLSSQTTIKTFNQETLNSALKSNLVYRKGISVSFVFPAIPLLAPVVFGSAWTSVATSAVAGIVGWGISGMVYDSARREAVKRADKIEERADRISNENSDLKTKYEVANSSLETFKQKFQDLKSDLEKKARN